MATTGQRISFWGFLLLMAREAVEPIALALGISLLYSRFQSVSAAVAGSGRGWLFAVNADSEMHPMIYLTLAIVLVAWVFYKAWKLKEDRMRDRALSDALTGLNRTLESLRDTIKESREDAGK